MTAGAIARTDPRPRLIIASAALVAAFASGVVAGVVVAPAIHGATAAQFTATAPGAAEQAYVNFVHDEAASYTQGWLTPGTSAERAYQLFLRGETESYGSSPAANLEQAQLLWIRGETGSYAR